MLQKERFEQAFQKIMWQYDDGLPKGALLQELVHKFNLDIQSHLHEQIEALLERKLTAAESEKIYTLSFLQYHGTGRKGKSYFRTAAILLTLVLVLQIIIGTPVYNPIEETTPTSPSKYPIVKPSLTLITTAISIITPTTSPTPQLKPTLQSGFRVEWHNESPDCKKEPLVITKKIIGAEIFGGAPPYKITFRQYNRVIATISIPFDGEVEFTNPVLVDKGENVYVTISFYQATKELTWNSYLFYGQIDAECQPQGN